MESAQKGIVNIAKKLDISLNEAADGIISVACNNMTTATIEILIGQGFDPRDFALMAFGGGGGIFAANIARDMSISRVIIPPSPGVFCARGILTMDLVHTYSRAYSRLLDKMDIKELEGIYTELEKAALMTIMEEGISKDKVEFIRSMDMGYEGQHHQVETPVPNGELTEGRKKTISDSFERLHEARYGHRLKNAFTTVNIRLKAIGNLKEISGTQIGQGKDVPAGAVKPTRKVYLDGGFVEARIYEREGLLWGNTITGPAIVEEPFHTTVILPDQVLTVDKLGSLIIGTGGA